MADDGTEDAELEELFAQMQSFEPDGEYYSIAIRADRSKTFQWEVYSHFVGWSPRGKHWEMREASLVKPTLITQMWDSVGRDWVAVHDDRHLGIWYCIGGQALVAAELAQDQLADVLAPSEVVHDGPISAGGYGFLGTDHLTDKAAESGLARGKVRMRVLERDGGRCLICGRRPKDYLDLKLNVHHIIPRRFGGPTAEENLITLCGECHEGLDPDYKPGLRELAELRGPSDPLDVSGDEMRADVERYRILLSQKALKP